MCVLSRTLRVRTSVYASVCRCARGITAHVRRANFRGN